MNRTLAPVCFCEVVDVFQQLYDVAGTPALNVALADAGVTPTLIVVLGGPDRTRWLVVASGGATHDLSRGRRSAA